MLDQQYVIASDIVSRNNTDGSVVIMKMDDSNNFFKINGVSADIWNGLSNQKNLNTIASDILNNYDITDDIVLKDINSVIHTLLEKNLIKKM